MKTDRKEAQEFYNNYFETFKGLATYLDETKASAERLGYTETMFGRRRYFSGLRSSIPYIRAGAERMAINAPIQGTEADIVKIAIKRIDDYLKEENLLDEAKLILQVHDEIVYEVREDLVEQLAPKLKEIMESVMDSKETHGVPIVAEASYGKDWNNLKRI